MFRKTLGVDKFHEFCARYGDKFSSYEHLCKFWGSIIRDIPHEHSRDLATFCKYGLLVTNYEEGILESEQNRSREYIQLLVHRDYFPIVKELCKDDATLPLRFIFTDADTEVEIRKKKKERDEKSIAIIAENEAENYINYAVVQFPLDAMFCLRENVANDIINNYVSVQIYYDTHGKSSRVIIFANCILKRIIDASN